MKALTPKPPTTIPAPSPLPPDQADRLEALLERLTPYVRQGQFYESKRAESLWHLGDELNRELCPEQTPEGRLKLGDYGDAVGRAVQERLGLSKSQFYLALKFARTFTLAQIARPDSPKALTAGVAALSIRQYEELLKVTDPITREALADWFSQPWGTGRTLPYLPTPLDRKGQVKTTDDLRLAVRRYLEMQAREGAGNGGKRRTVRQAAPAYEVQLNSVIRTLRRNPIEAVCRIGLWLGRLDPTRADNPDALREQLDILEGHLDRIREAIQ